MANEPKYVVVTGAASGIGLGITEYLASKGYHIFATDIDEDSLSKFGDREKITPIVMDVTKTESIEKAKKEIQKTVSEIDALVNNAGIFVGGPLVEIPEEKVERIIDVNVLGVFRTTKLFFPLLRQKKGRIVNIGSEAGRISFPLNGPYSMSKYALEAYSDSLRRELMFLDMKVIHLQVGAINTPLINATLCAYADEIDINKTHFKNLIEEVIQTCETEQKNCANTEDVAKVVYKALKKKKPKARYRIKNNKTRRFLEFLPTRLLDSAMKKRLQ